MSEKAKLKDTDEIFSSIGKRTAKQPSAISVGVPLPAGPDEQRAGDGADELKPDLSLNLTSEERRPAPRIISSSPMPEQELDAAETPPARTAEENESNKDSAAPNAEAGTGSGQRRARKSAQKKPGNPPKDEGSKEKKPAARRGRPRKTPVSPPEPQGDEGRAISFEKYTFPSLEEPEAGKRAEQANAGKQPPAAEIESAPKTVSKRRQKRASANTSPPAVQRNSDPEAMENEDYRSKFLKRLSSQFEQEFTQRFEHKPEEEKAPIPEGSWFDLSSKEKAPSNDPPLLPEEEEAIKAEAEQFMQQFEEEVRREEEAKVEAFKDTLAEKFMRERERYLRELGIPENEEDTPAQPRQEPEAPAAIPPLEPEMRRRLDIHIQPEMHIQTGETPAPRAEVPLTYTRSAVVWSQTEEEVQPIPSKSIPAGKKTAEQLLLELAAQSQHKEHKKATSGKQPKPRPQLDFSFAIPEESVSTPPKKRSSSRLRWTRKRTVLVSALAGVVLLGLAGYSLASALRGDPASGEGLLSLDSSQLESYTIYESRNFDPRGSIDNVLVKKSGISIKNLAVKNYLVIDEITTPGAIQLNDVSVDGAIYVNSCAVDRLELTNVQSERIIINNNEAKVTVTASGYTTVGALEARTPVAVAQQNMDPGADGIRTVLAESSEGSVSQMTLDGLRLQTVSTRGEAVVEMKNDTLVETFTAEGPLSLSGNGKVINLSAAGGTDGPVPVRLNAVSVANLNLKDQASLELDAQVDAMAASGDLSMGGNGNVGIVTLNPQLSGSRLLVDVSGGNVQHLIANTQVRVNSVGGSQINTLTANDSVYALGKKVNHLIVNADGVIYENQPDSITVAGGIHPPQTMADNPNLDYNLTTTQSILPGDDDDGIATTCGHPRENGGFIKGDGSRDDPFVVSSAAQLAHVSEHLSSHFIQTSNIDIADDSAYAGGFPAVGSAGSPFSGVYDGGGFTISNLRIISAGESMGLFAENTGTIQNVHLASGEISATSAGRSFVGGIVGFNYQNGAVLSCSNGAKVTGNAGSYVGGIAGYNYTGRIRDCYNTAKISGQSYVGGLVGMNHTNASISGSYNVGTIEGDSEVGGVAGANSGAVVTNSYYLQDTAPQGIGSGSGTAAQKTSEEMMSDQMVADLSAGGDSSLWTRGDSSESGYNYPVLRSPSSA